MKNRYIRQALTGLTLAAALGAGTVAAHAQATYHVSLDTSTLSAGYQGPLSLDFQFIDGGVPDNNTVTVTGFDFGAGGSAPADDTGATYTGNASGGLASGAISLVDDAQNGIPFNELYETFTPGSTFSFDVTLTTNLDTTADPSFSPDAFVFAVLDGNGNNIATEDFSGINSLVTIDVDSSTPTATAFATLPDQNGVSIMPAVAGAPEPSQTAALGLGVLSLAGLLLKAHKRRAL